MQKDYLEALHIASSLVDEPLQEITKKEILHYEILSLMDKEKLFETLTFAGGTSLRLCYGSNRLSEDLDFNASKDYKPHDFIEFAEKAKNYFSDTFGIEVNVKEPKRLRSESEQGKNNFDHVNVDRWQISFELTPDRPDVPRSRVKLEVAEVPAYTREIMAVRSNYPQMFDDPKLFLPVENITEIMADKLVSFPANQRYIRYRDMWDLPYLSKLGAIPNLDFIEKKLSDYKIADFEKRLLVRINSLPDLVKSHQFVSEMERFLNKQILNSTLKENDASQAFLETLNDLLVNTHKGLYQRNKGVPVEKEGLTDPQSKSRAESIHLISGGSHPRTVFRDVAKEVMDANKKMERGDWLKIEKTAIQQSIEKGHHPRDIEEAMMNHSPICLTKEDRERVSRECKNALSKVKKQATKEVKNKDIHHEK